MTVYADWPLLDELKQVLDVTSDDWDGDMDGTRLTGVLDSAVEHVKRATGFVEYEDVPTIGQAKAALRMAELMATRPTDPVKVLGLDPTYLAHLYGERRRWGIG